MSKFTIEYVVEEAGWATATISDGDSVKFDVSYLHDSLGDLARSSIDLRQGSHAEVLFVDEPGERQLILDRSNDSLTYALTWSSKWDASGAPKDLEPLLSGTTTVKRYQHQVRKVLDSIFDELGPKTYLERWQNHEFPMEIYSAIRGT